MNVCAGDMVVGNVRCPLYTTDDLANGDHIGFVRLDDLMLVIAVNGKHDYRAVVLAPHQCRRVDQRQFAYVWVNDCHETW